MLYLFVCPPPAPPSLRQFREFIKTRGGTESNPLKGTFPAPGQKGSISLQSLHHLHLAAVISLKNQTNKTFFFFSPPTSEVNRRGGRGQDSQNSPAPQPKRPSALPGASAEILMQVRGAIWNFIIQKEPGNTNFYSAIMSSNKKKKASGVRGYKAPGPVTSFH